MSTNPPANADEHAIEEAMAELPAPTAWPMLLALGVVLAAFGIITNGLFFYAGLVILTIALVGWMRLLVVEARHSSGHEGTK